MKYTLLAIIVACVVIFIASGCSVYYPTSYRAFIPRILDSDYKEYQRLCKEEIGKVVYARPLTQNERATLIQEIRGKLIESEKTKISKKIKDDIFQATAKEKNINIGDIITAKLLGEILVESDKRVEAIVSKEVAKKEAQEKIESNTPYQIPSTLTIHALSKSVIEMRRSFALSSLETINKSKELIFYQVRVGYIYDRHWTEYMWFSKGKPTSEKFLECKKDSFEKEALSQILNNSETIGLESDVILTNYHYFWQYKER